MGQQLGDTFAVGALSTSQIRIPGTALWTCFFDVSQLPRNQDFEVYHGSALGPGGNAFVYLNDKLYGFIENGSFSEYNPRSSAMYVRKGQTITIVWSIGSGKPPIVHFWMRVPEVGRI